MKPDPVESMIDRLKKVQTAKGIPEPSGQFEQKVMREIRRQQEDPAAPWWVSLQPLVLRFAVSTALVAALMLAVGLEQGMGPSYELAEVVLELEEENTLNDLPEL